MPRDDWERARRRDKAKPPIGDDYELINPPKMPAPAVRLSNRRPTKKSLEVGKLIICPHCKKSMKQSNMLKHYRKEHRSRPQQ